MISTLAILVLAAGVILLEVPSLLEKKLNRELWAFSVLLTMVIALGIARSFNVNIPSPFYLISIIYKPMTDFLQTILH